MVNDSSLSDDWAPVRLTPKYWLIFRIFKILSRPAHKNMVKSPPSTWSLRQFLTLWRNHWVIFGTCLAPISLIQVVFDQEGGGRFPASPPPSWQLIPNIRETSADLKCRTFDSRPLFGYHFKMKSSLFKEPFFHLPSFACDNLCVTDPDP